MTFGFPPLRAGIIFGRPFAQTAAALISNASVGVKTVCVAVLIGYGLSFSNYTLLSLSLTPGYLFPPDYLLWTLFTHCFMEIHLWEVLVDIVTLVLVGKLLEPLWGALEMLTFFFVVNVGVAICCVISCYIIYVPTRNLQFLFDVHIHGLAGYLAGVSVAVKQAMPDVVLFQTPFGGKFSNKNIPLSVFLLTVILWTIGLVEGSYCAMFSSGLCISWIYLRFYQVHANGTRGDTADSFAFVSFFPNVLQPAVGVISNTVFSVMLLFRICKRPVRKYDVGGGSGAISISLPGAESQDAERRRQIALKALSERLSKSSTELPQQSWPTLDEPQQEQQQKEESVHVTTTDTGGKTELLVETFLDKDSVLIDIASAAAAPSTTEPSAQEK